jgi:hypothetical protein
VAGEGAGGSCGGGGELRGRWRGTGRGARSGHGNGGQQQLDGCAPGVERRDDQGYRTSIGGLGLLPTPR